MKVQMQGQVLRIRIDESELARLQAGAKPEELELATRELERARVSLSFSEAEANRAREVVDAEFAHEIQLRKVDPLLIESDLSIVALVGEQMKNHQGISGKMFSTLGKNNVNIRAIAQGASERNISVVINENDVKKALNTLHERFFEEQTKQLNLFVMGVGNVGEKFIEQIHQQKKFLKENLKINLRVIALSNSRKMLFEE